MSERQDETDLVPVEVVEPTIPRSKPLLDRPLLVLAILFGATAALGLPLLWQSRAFSVWTKTWLSIVLVLYTIAILWLFAMVMAWSWSRISGALNG
jgi:hypothetical protein